MRKIIITIFILIAWVGITHAQFPIPQKQGQRTSQITAEGAYGTKTGFAFEGNYTDTATANLASYISGIPGFVIRVNSSELWVRNQTANAWVIVGGGGTGNRYMYTKAPLFPFNDSTIAADTSSVGLFTAHDGSVVQSCRSFLYPMGVDSVIILGSTNSKDNSFPYIVITNTNRLIQTNCKGNTHGSGGLPVYRFSDDFGVTWGAEVELETDTATNYRNLVITAIRGDTLLATYWTGGGVLYKRYSVNDGDSWSARAAISISGVTRLATENHPIYWNGRYIIPVYSFAPDVDRSGIIYNTSLVSGTWTAVWNTNGTSLQLNESSLTPFNDSVFQFFRSEFNTDTCYRAASVDGITWSAAAPVGVIEFIAGNPATKVTTDGRILMNYRSREATPITPDEGLVGISLDRGLTWDTLFVQTQQYWTYGDFEYLGDDLYICVHSIQAPVPYASVYYDYYKIPSCRIQGIVSSFEKPGSPFNVMDEYFKGLIGTQGSGLFVHLSDVDETALGKKVWADTATFNMLTSVKGGFVVQSEGNSSSAFIGASGGSTPSTATGQGVTIWRAGMQAKNVTTLANTPFDFYASAFGFNIGDVTMAANLITPNYARQTDSTGYDVDLIQRSTGLHKKMYINSFLEFSGVPTLQQIFNKEVGGSVFTKKDTINVGALYNLTILGTTPFVTSDGLLRVLNTSPVGNGGIAIFGRARDGRAILGISDSSGVGVHGTTQGVGGIGVYAQAGLNSDVALLAESINGYAATLQTDSISDNDVVPILRINRSSGGSGFGQNGIGGSIVYTALTTLGENHTSNNLVSKWADATTGTRTSQFDITGVNSAATETYANFQTGGIVRVNNLADTLSTKAYARSLAASGVIAWNVITDPTGDQALAFAAGESSTWTSSNTTEDLFTVTTSTLTTGSLFSLNSTGTALAAGNNIAEFIMSGANGTNAITATAVRASVTNTNATSGTNVAFDATASGATTANYAILATGTIAPHTSGSSALGTATLPFANVFLIEGAAINFDNGDAVMAQAGNTVTLTGANFVFGNSALDLTTNRIGINVTTPLAGIDNRQGTEWIFNSGVDAEILLGESISAGGFALINWNRTTDEIRITNNALIAIRVDEAQRTSFGNVTPSALVTIAGGTATASTAPLKFTSGTNLTTAEAGVVEYNGSNFFFTATAAARRQAVLSNVATPTSGYFLVANGTDYTLTDPTAITSLTGLPYIKVTGTSTLTGAATIDLSGEVFTMSEGGNAFLSLDPAANSETITIRAFNTTADDNLGRIIVSASDANGQVFLRADFNDGVETAEVAMFADATTSTITLSTDEVRVTSLAGSGSRAVLADAEGDLTAPVSDRSVKKAIQPLTSGLNQLMQLQPVTFEYVNDFSSYGSGTQVGFIAQDVQRVLPNSVYMNMAGKAEGKLGINTIDIIPLLVRSIQEQQAQIEKLTIEVNKLKSRSN